MHYLESGKGKPIICIPGLAADSFVYRKNIPSLAKHFKVYAIDLIGSGLSDKPYRRYTIKFYTDQIARFINLKKLKSAVMIGTSWGGALAIAIALKCKAKISKLILIDSAVSIRKPLVVLGVKSLLQAVRYLHEGKRSFQWTKKYFQRRQRILYYNDKFLTEKALNHYLRIWKMPEGREALISSVLHCDFSYLIKRVCEITQDTLIIWGAEDPIFPLEGARWLHQRIKDSQLKIIPDAGHCPLETKPKVINKLMIDFIKS